MRTFKRNSMIGLLILYGLTVLVMSEENPKLLPHFFIIYGGIFIIPMGFLQLYAHPNNDVAKEKYRKAIKLVLGIAMIFIGSAILLMDEFGLIYTVILIGASILMIVWKFFHNHQRNGELENSVLGHRFRRMGEKSVGFIIR